MGFGRTRQGSGFGIRSGVLVLFLMGLLHCPWASADEMTDPSGQAGYPFMDERPNDALGEFLQLRDKLPTAICDESYLSRPPSLASLHSEERSGPLASHRIEFRVHYSIDELDLIPFLLGDSQKLVGAPGVLSRWSEEQRKSDPLQKASALKKFKRSIAHEVCTALITPSKLTDVFRQEHGLLISLAVGSKGPSKPPYLSLRDVNSRFAKLPSGWQLGGWIEPFEVSEAHFSKRNYIRLSNAITNQTYYIVVTDSDGVPVGFIHRASGGGAQMTRSGVIDAMIKASRTEPFLKKRTEIYQLMIESRSYQALSQKPKAANQIRKLQEFYRNLFKAYEAYPDSPQFKSYGKFTVQVSPKELGKSLDANYFQSLSRLQIDGASVEFELISPDKKMFRIFQEFEKEVEKI